IRQSRTPCASRPPSSRRRSPGADLISLLRVSPALPCTASGRARNRTAEIPRARSGDSRTCEQRGSTRPRRAAARPSLVRIAVAQAVEEPPDAVGLHARARSLEVRTEAQQPRGELRPRRQINLLDGAPRGEDGSALLPERT